VKVKPIPALLFHKVTPRWEVGITSVFPSQFQRQMEILASTGWKTVLPKVVKKTASGNSKKFSLIFDDGYECIIRYALPVLDRLNFQSTIFMPTGFIGKLNDWDHQLLGRRFRHLDWGMLQELMSAGWKIQSHTVSHRDLTGLDDESMRDELRCSKEVLEDRLGKVVDWISFPFGRYDSRVINMAEEIGYSGAVVPVVRHTCDNENFTLIGADAIYIWDSVMTVISHLERCGWRYNFWHPIKRMINSASYGTVYWQKLFK
jgi:peptidoglycan/xylan/chitin deacetylase (PgdA/CDA1 family)